MPNDRWTSDATTKRKRILFYAIGSISMILLAVAGYFAVKANRASQKIANQKIDEIEITGSDGDTEFTPGSNNENEDIGSKSESNLIVESGEKTEMQLDDQGNRDTAINGIASKEPSDQNQSEAPPQAASIKSESSTTDSDTTSVGSIENGHTADNEQPEQAEMEIQKQEKSTDNTSPFDDVFDDLLQSNPAELAPINSEFGELSSALESVDTTVLEINQLAKVESGPRRIGLPKYFIEKPEPLDPRNFDRLDQLCGGMQSSNQTVTSLIGQISIVTGIPIAWDAESLAASGFDFAAKVEEFKVMDSTFKEVVEQVLRTSTIEVEMRYNGQPPAVVFPASSSQLRTISVEIPPLSKRTPTELLEIIKQMVNPGTWDGDEYSGTLNLEQNEFQFTHQVTTLDLTASFFEKWRAAAAIGIQGQKRRVDSIPSRWRACQSAREQMLQIENQRELYIESFFTQIQSKTGITVLVDYRTLLDDGWNHLTRIPFEVQEVNLELLLEEISHSMAIDYRSVDPMTFELLASDFGKHPFELEFYGCDGILSGSLNVDQMVRILQQSLDAAAIGRDAYRAYFEQEISALIVVAPQRIQRQIEAVLLRLEPDI